MGGSKPSPPQVIVPPPPQILERPQPNPAETSRQLFESQLQFNPQLTQQQVGLQQQFAPQLAQLATDIQRTQAPQLLQSQLESAQTYAPLFRALIEQQFPQIPVLSRQILGGLTSLESLTPEEQALQEAGRQRAREQIQRNIREAANLGGTLFGGQRQEAETEALSRFEQDILSQDIARRQQERAQRLAELTQLFQLAGFQVQQPQVGIPGVPQFGQPVTPSADALLAAMTQTNLNPIVQPAVVTSGIPGTPGSGGQIAGGITSVLTAKLLMKCLPGSTFVDTDAGLKPIDSLTVDDTIDGQPILILQSYAAMPTTFVKLTLRDGRWVETCDAHLIAGKPAIAYERGENLSGSIIETIEVSTRTEKTYDLLTFRPDGGYTCQGITVASMIPLMHRLAHRLQEVA